MAGRGLGRRLALAGSGSAPVAAAVGMLSARDAGTLRRRFSLMLVAAASLHQDGLYLSLLLQPVSDPACAPLMGTVPSWLVHADLRGLVLPVVDRCLLVPRPA